MITDDLVNGHGFNEETSTVSSHDTIIKVVGVGGGGGNAISHMFKKGCPNISYALCNTDKQAMYASPVPVKIILGPTVTRGLGAGNNPSVAAEAAEESIPEITRMFQDNTKMAFITAGMGGGTGTGAAPIVAKVAREMGILTIGIVTIPFLMEGESKILKALAGAKEMSKYVDALMVINNEILVEQYGELDFVTAFSKADDTLANAANSIAELIYTEGLINVDFKDVETTLKNGGVAVISTGYGEGERRVTEAVKDALNSPLLRNNDIQSSKRILFNLYSNPNAQNKLKMSEINEFREWTKKISGLDLIYGIADDPSLGEKVKVSILASGFKSYVLKDDEEDFENLRGKTIGGDFNFVDESQVKHKAKDENDLMEKFYGKEKVDSFKEHKDSVNFITLTKDLMEDDNVLELLEKTPAYNRNTADAEAIRAGRIRDEFNFNNESTYPERSENTKNSSNNSGIIDFC